MNGQSVLLKDAFARYNVNFLIILIKNCEWIHNTKNNQVHFNIHIPNNMYMLNEVWLSTISPNIPNAYDVDSSSPWCILSYMKNILSLLFLCELTLCLEVEPAFPFPLMDTKMRLSVYLNEY